MAKESEFGHKIPRYGDIVRIEGNDVYDADGDKFSRDLLWLNKLHGGDLELVSLGREKTRTRKPKETK